MDKSDFVIQKDVLKRYKGSGGTVVIPEGVKKIGDGTDQRIHSRKRHCDWRECVRGVHEADQRGHSRGGLSSA